MKSKFLYSLVFINGFHYSFYFIVVLFVICFVLLALLLLGHLDLLDWKKPIQTQHICMTYVYECMHI